MNISRRSFFLDHSQRRLEHFLRRHEARRRFHSYGIDYAKDELSPQLALLLLLSPAGAFFLLWLLSLWMLPPYLAREQETVFLDGVPIQLIEDSPSWWGVLFFSRNLLLMGSIVSFFCAIQVRPHAVFRRDGALSRERSPTLNSFPAFNAPNVSNAPRAAVTSAAERGGRGTAEWGAERIDAGRGRTLFGAPRASSLQGRAWERGRKEGPSPSTRPVADSALSIYEKLCQRRSCSSEEGLNRLLEHEEQARQDQRRRRQLMGWSGDAAFARAVSERRSVGFGAAAVERGKEAADVGPKVHYLPTPLTAHPAVATVSATSVAEFWAALQVFDVENGLRQIREWCARTLSLVWEDVTRCDKWLVTRRLEAFDCHHALSESVASSNAAVVTQPAVFGGAMAASGTFPKTKMDALLIEREKCSRGAVAAVPYPSNTFSTSMAAPSPQQARQQQEMKEMIELRVQLESVFDIESSFPLSLSSGSTSQPNETRADAMGLRERHARQRYLLHRLQKLSSQRFLEGYHHARGDERWTDAFPGDAMFLIHVLATRHRRLRRHILLAHEPLRGKNGLAIKVGHDGAAPLFFVAHRRALEGNGLGSQWPREGATRTWTPPSNVVEQSLFEALLIFFAIVRRDYEGTFGGVIDVLDLRDLGLHRLFET